MSAMRVNHYPSLTTPPLPGQLRAGSHSDYGCLTILLQKDGESGLEAVGLDNEWHPVPHQQNGFTVNIGDMIQVWTNGLYKSTLHRVVVPDEAPSPSRMSIAFFQQANPEAMVTCVPTCIPADGSEPDNAPMTAGDHVMAKSNATKG